ncbi:hypothetical protein MCOR25_006723 [Pyricularia grisea]|nr:hypothetical protein MCOR25_006723 [Pyricularia grisea]
MSGATSKQYQDAQPTMREKYPALAFLMRHVDATPSISYTRFSDELRHRATDTAIGLALCGEPGAATRIIELLRTHSLDPFDPHNEGSTYARPAMYFAWEATRSWPGWIPPEERTEDRLNEIEAEARKPWLERFTEEWKVDGETAAKALEMSRASINNVFPSVSAVERIQLANKWFQDGYYGYASNPMGPFSARYIKIQGWWRRGLYPFPWQQLFRSAGLSIALDIQLKPGLDKDAKETFEQICERITFTEQLEMLACSRSAWQSGLFTPDKGAGNTGSRFVKLLELSQTDLHACGLRAVEQLAKRLRNGPERPFRDKTVAELAQLISAHTYENCDFNELEIYGPPIERPADANGLLHEPCHPDELADLKHRLSTAGADPDLPQDYEELLAATNGLEPFWDGGFRLRLLAPAREVTTATLSFFERGSGENSVLSLLPPGYHGRIEWPPMPDRVVSLSGAEDREGDGDGDLWLIDRATTARCKEAVLEALARSDGDARRRLQVAVEDIYGSLQRFRELEFGVVSWRHWDPEGVVPYDGVRGMLEVMAEKSMHRYMLWDPCFRPNQRISKERPPFVI